MNSERFMRKAEKGDAYRKLKDREQAKEHRGLLFDKKIEAVEAKLSKSNIWSLTSNQGMRYRTPAKILEDLGGISDPTVIEGVVRGCTKCIAMGSRGSTYTPRRVCSSS